MTPVRRPTRDVESEAYQPDSPPPIRNGGADHSFTLQAVMELKGSLGELTGTVKSLNASVEALSKKLDKMDDKLSGVTHKLYAAGVVLAIALATGGFLVNKAWDMMAAQIVAKPAPQPPPPPTSK